MSATQVNRLRYIRLSYKSPNMPTSMRQFKTTARVSQIEMLAQGRMLLLSSSHRYNPLVEVPWIAV